MSLASLRTHTDAIIARLTAQGLVVGDGDDPSVAHAWQGGVGQSSFIGYVIVYPLLGGTFDGSLGEPDDDADLLWQLTCVGFSRKQCEKIVDDALAALIGHPLAVTGRSVSRLFADLAGGGARRDDTAAGPPLFIATPRVRAMSYPA